MKRRIIVTSFIIMAVCSISTVHAQVGLFVPKDERIARFQKDILQYLVKEKQFLDNDDQITLENYQDRMIVRRCLEVYSDTSANDVLLIKFKATSDHGDRFWGVLTQKRSYLFYNFEDPQFLLLKKELNLYKVKLIESCCKNNH